MCEFSYSACRKLNPLLAYRPEAGKNICIRQISYKIHTSWTEIGTVHKSIKLHSHTSQSEQLPGKKGMVQKCQKLKFLLFT